MQVLKVPTEAHAVGIEMKIVNANKKIFFLLQQFVFMLYCCSAYIYFQIQVHYVLA